MYRYTEAVQREGQLAAATTAELDTLASQVAALTSQAGERATAVGPYTLNAFDP